jgi:hypothetical protein
MSRIENNRINFLVYKTKFNEIVFVVFFKCSRLSRVGDQNDESVSFVDVSLDLNPITAVWSPSNASVYTDTSVLCKFTVVITFCITTIIKITV